jgi:group I intron endonuclease
MILLYKIVNDVNDKLYVGRTVCSLRKRFVEHCTPKSCCHKLRKAIQKYGKRRFRIELITIAATPEIADVLERHFISKFESVEHGYNIALGGLTSPMAGRKHSEATRAKLSAAHGGRKPMLGKKHSESTKRRLSEVKKGCVGHQHSEQTKERLRAANIGGGNPMYGQVAWNRGVSPSDATRSKQAAAKTGRSWRLVDGRRVWTPRNYESTNFTVVT